MNISPYVSFDGRCEEAFTFYARSLDGTLGPLFRYAGSPMAADAPPEWQDKIMHGSVRIGGLELMGADITADRYEKAKGFSLSSQVDDASNADRIFGELAREGTIVMPLEKTFWAERFGIVADRFGIQWLINCEGSGLPTNG